MNGCQINTMHCEQCGSTSAEDVGFAATRSNDGYSACCNEIVSWDAAGCRNHHGEEGR